MKDLIHINGKAYAFNLQKICEFISKAAGKGIKETEILDTYDFEESKKSITNKTVRELNTTGNGQDPLIYDLIKTILIQVSAFDDVGDVDLEELPFGTKIAFNTLINEGFLIEINNGR